MSEDKDGIAVGEPNHVRHVNVEKLFHMNQRLNLVLGYAMGFIMPYGKAFENDQKERYEWLKKAIENLVYLDKPLPPMP